MQPLLAKPLPPEWAEVKCTTSLLTPVDTPTCSLLFSRSRMWGDSDWKWGKCPQRPSTQRPLLAASLSKGAAKQDGWTWILRTRKLSNGSLCVPHAPLRLHKIWIRNEKQDKQKSKTKNKSHKYDLTTCAKFSLQAMVFSRMLRCKNKVTGTQRTEQPHTYPDLLSDGDSKELVLKHHPLALDWILLC